MHPAPAVHIVAICRLPPLTCGSHRTLQQVTDDDIALLCANLGRFKRLKKMTLVSTGVGQRGLQGRRGGVALRLKA